MAERSFTHLHTHTEFSMLDGTARVTDLVEAAVADGQPALGITDHGNMYGVLDFYAACRKAGINPIIGTEAYMAAESRHERPVRRGKVDDTGGDAGGGEKLYYHLTLLAESNEGYRNLLKLSSAAYLEGYYYKPRLDWELLERHAKGLIATTGCLGGVVLQALLADDQVKAEMLAGRLQDIFGKGNLFVEVQDHGLPEQHRTNPTLVEIAHRIGAPLLATNDSHYIRREDHFAHDALLCVQTGALIDDPKRFKFEGEEHYLKSAAEMRHLFRELPEACDNTLLIAERANVEIEFGKPSLPQFPVPDEFTGETYEVRASAYLRHLSIEGAKERYGMPIPAEVMQRLDYELEVIANMGFSAYFLVVWDLIHFARSQHIRVGPGWGGTAGCCTAYCLQIVDLDPLKHDLLFERFLNPSRIQMPHIDTEIDGRFRSDMINYLADRYGSDHVAQIVRFSIFDAQVAVRDASHILGSPSLLGDQITRAMPDPMYDRFYPGFSRLTPIQACLTKMQGYEEEYELAGELRSLYEMEPEVKRVVNVALGIEGLHRGIEIDPSAVVITDQPLTEYLPLQRNPGAGKPDNAPIVTQYDSYCVQDLGLTELRITGKPALSLIERALDLIDSSTGYRPDINHIPRDDELTFEMLRKGASIGVFELDSPEMRSLLPLLVPTSFEDIPLLIALDRPGPRAAGMHIDIADRKNGRQPITYLHPDLEEDLADTYGLMIYQESVMRVVQKFAGYTLAEADNLRKACGKKIRALIEAEREKFVAGSVTEGYGEELGTALFDIVEPFADYAFSKSHAYSYALTAYHTAWLKAHHPVPYMSALLNSVPNGSDQYSSYLFECRTMGIERLLQFPDQLSDPTPEIVKRREETISSLATLAFDNYHRNRNALREVTADSETEFLSSLPDPSGIDQTVLRDIALYWRLLDSRSPLQANPESLLANEPESAIDPIPTPQTVGSPIHSNLPTGPKISPSPSHAVLSGDALELAVTQLLGNLFALDSPDKTGWKLRRQHRGEQYGFDISFIAPAQALGAPCFVECKNYHTSIKYEQVVAKLHLAKQNWPNDQVDHWAG